MADETESKVDKIEQSVTSKVFDTAQKAQKGNVITYTGNMNSIAGKKAANRMNLLNLAFGHQEKLYANRLATNQRIQQLNAEFVEATQDVLNEKTLQFLVDHSKINVPTFTSIVAGFELARASRADKLERLVEGEQRRLLANEQAEAAFVGASDNYHEALAKTTDTFYNDIGTTQNNAFTVTTNATNADTTQAYYYDNMENQQQHAAKMSEVGFQQDVALADMGYNHAANMSRMQAEQSYAMGNGGAGGGNTVFNGNGDGVAGVGGLALGSENQQTNSNGNVTSVVPGGGVVSNLISQTTNNIANGRGPYSGGLGVIPTMDKNVPNTNQLTPEQRRQIYYNNKQAEINSAANMFGSTVKPTKQYLYNNEIKNYVEKANKPLLTESDLGSVGGGSINSMNERIKKEKEEATKWLRENGFSPNPNEYSDWIPKSFKSNTFRNLKSESNVATPELYNIDEQMLYANNIPQLEQTVQPQTYMQDDFENLQASNVQPQSRLVDGIGTSNVSEVKYNEQSPQTVGNSVGNGVVQIPVNELQALVNDPFVNIDEMGNIIVNKPKDDDNEIIG